MMHRRHHWLLLLPLLLSPTLAGAEVASDSERAIRDELARSATAWNRGDLETFLDSYERGTTTAFVTNKEVLHGFDAIAEMYRSHHRKHDPKQMGQLTFSDLELRLLGADTAVAIGRWSLARAASEGGHASGWFTLTWRKGPAGWRIVVDHTP